MANSVQLFKALTDETRLRILALLGRQELCVCQIVQTLGIGQSKASRHLAHLKNAGLVKDRRDGLWMHYSLAPPDGWLHGELIQWLLRADSEIPLAAADFDALGNLPECGDLCPEDSPRKGNKRQSDVAAISSLSDTS